MKPIRIATRGSDLALAQARYVAARLEAELEARTELVVVTTSGDRMQDVSLAEIGGKGLFIKEIEQALNEGRADLAVHSAKDLPAEIAPGLELVAFPERADPRDALVAQAPGQTLKDLPLGSSVGTGSIRRAALLRALRPDLEIVPLRGNVPTRLAKLESQNLAAVILACAGLDRLGRAEVISERISLDQMLPAVCQGTLALETREGDAAVEGVARLGSPENTVAASAERAFLSRVGGDCTLPLAAHCESMGKGQIRVRALLASPDGATVVRSERVGSAEEAAEIGAVLADEILRAGGRELLQDLSSPGQGDNGS